MGVEATHPKCVQKGTAPAGMGSSQITAKSPDLPIWMRMNVRIGLLTGKSKLQV